MAFYCRGGGPLQTHRASGGWDHVNHLCVVRRGSQTWV